MSRFRPSTVRAHWITGLSVLAAGFLVFLSVAALSTSDPRYETTDRILGVVTGVGAVALVGGLWALRMERLGSWAAGPT